MRGLPDLPYELLMVIFDYPERSSLVSICLISRSIYLVALKALYRSIVINTDREKQDKDKSLWFTIEKSPVFAPIVHTIFITSTTHWGFQEDRSIVISYSID
ncbi:hypothetical protein FRB91_005191 [Serendipita sp. 411]|nr:hypothetical protein FRC15_004896 [Serendipita sp. 397]KAG8774353.1 hypothetical protein FRC16_005105 [Serendipita sp. 398]KAG8807460.1 hypothetical protein FRC18_005553 [Serendipita sp. 400]KAG8820854.1 hypothetical protein FRC19_008550 [Serendipita sp. 401]KAG8840757.1 hypothetical protein FRC20_005432 [Serendipita sp. 405]KAG8841258.1 hypothetical protein FRB91_005191 [Serendipita sp. 411]KAG9053582.1 hypothetical protein FS842_007772 [Serendipita sp. 407]